MNTDPIVALAAGPLPAVFACAAVEIPAGSSLAYDAATRQGALVLLTSGKIRLVLYAGEVVCFTKGAVLALQNLTLRCIDNAGSQPAVLVALTRARLGRPVCSTVDTTHA